MYISSNPKIVYLKGYFLSDVIGQGYINLVEILPILSPDK